VFTRYQHSSSGIYAMTRSDFFVTGPGRFAGGHVFPTKEAAMDDDLSELPREALIEEVKRLRAGIRAHRDSSKHELCWHHPQLWALLPEKTDPLPEVPEWPQFMRGCIRYRQSLDRQLPAAKRVAKEFSDDA
jgi:hypothetical protein